jgi:hypothetical protein
MCEWDSLKACSNRGCISIAGSLSNTANVDTDAEMTGKMQLRYAYTKRGEIRHCTAS